jgi:site-specific DNA-cytosine methylase
MTQKEQLLKYFREIENNITTLECVQKLYILDLQSVIRDLKKEGYNIMDFWINHTNIFGKATSFKRYYLIQDDVDMANFELDKKYIQDKE